MTISNGVSGKLTATAGNNAAAIGANRKGYGDTANETYGKLKITGGTTITTGEGEVTIPKTVESVTVPSAKLDEVAAGTEEGSVRVPAGTKVTSGEGKTVDLPRGGTIKADGTIQKNRSSKNTSKLDASSVLELISENGVIISEVSEENFEKFIEAAELYEKLSAAEQEKADKAVKEQTGKEFKELTTAAYSMQSLADAKATLQSFKLRARSKLTKLNGKKAIKLSWYIESGEISEMGFDGYEVYRSTKKTSGFGKKAYYKTQNT